MCRSRVSNRAHRSSLYATRVDYVFGHRYRASARDQSPAKREVSLV